MCITWKNTREEIAAYATLAEDWDGYGAAPIKPEAIADALVFSRLVEAAGYWPPTPGPAGDGEVGLWWHVPMSEDRPQHGRVHIDLGFYGTSTLSFFARSEGNVNSSADDHPIDRLPAILLPHLDAHRELKAAAGRDAVKWAQDAGVPSRVLAAICRVPQAEADRWPDRDWRLDMVAAGRLVSLRCLFENVRHEVGAVEDGVTLGRICRFWQAGPDGRPPLWEILASEEWDGRAIVRTIRMLWPYAANLGSSVEAASALG